MKKRSIKKVEIEDLSPNSEDSEDLVITTTKIKSKGGRPKVENKVDKKEQTYLTEYEQNELISLAQETGKSKAKLIREAIINFYNMNQ